VSTQTELATGVAAMPRVNLMPPEIAEAERFRRLQVAMGCAVVASAAVVGVLYMHAKSGISSAQTEVNTAQAQQAALNAKLNSLASVKQTFAEVQNKQALLQQAMGQEIRWSYMLNDLSFRIPSDVWLGAMQASETTTLGGSTGNPVATMPGSTAAAIGSVSFSGYGMKQDDVATWLDSLSKEKGFADPTFSSSTETAIGSTSVVSFQSSVVLDTSALSNRFVQKAGS
jgi:Tfp pilus assembly protein PilN